MVKVEVLKLAGETGLRKAGTCYMENEARAEKLVSAGLVKYFEPVKVKEDKTQYETKELKTVRNTKKKK